MSDDLLLFRFVETLLPSDNVRSIAILTGARQTGKTTSAQRKYPDLRYINLDAPENRDALRLLSTSAWAKTVGPAVLDEAQKEPVVFEKVKYAFDSQALSFSVMLGSSQILLLKKVRESLAGRSSVFELWPLMMSEIHTIPGIAEKQSPLLDRLINGTDISKALRDEPELLLDAADEHCRAAEDYLLSWGGMPALLSLSPITLKLRWMESCGCARKAQKTR